MNQALPTLEERLAREDYHESVAALQWHRYWKSPDDSWETALDVWPGAALYSPGLAQTLLTSVLKRFPARSQDEARMEMLDRATYYWAFESSEMPNAVIDELSRPRRCQPQPSDGAEAERNAIVSWMHAMTDIARHRTSRAIDRLDGVVRTAPDSAVRLRREVGRTLEELARDLMWRDTLDEPRYSPEGMKAAQLATEVDPESSRAAAFLATAFNLRANDSKFDAQAGRAYAQQALEQCERALELDERNRLAMAVRGHVLRDLGRLEEALAAYDRGLEAEPESSIFKLGRGRVFIILARYEDALSIAEELLRDDEQDAFALDLKANALYFLGRYDESLVALEEAIALEDPRGASETSRAFLLWFLGRPDAEDAFRQTIEKHRRIGAFAGLARLLIEKGDLGGAEVILKRAPLAESPSLLRGVLLWHKGEAGYIDTLNDYLADSSISQTVSTPLVKASSHALALALLGEEEEARSVFRDALPYRAPPDSFRRPEFDLVAGSDRCPSVVREMIATLWGSS
jgi:tetratricopeptide (TPR) repeat protein